MGSSVPANICTTLKEQRPTRWKESHILEGLRKLQRRKQRSSSGSSRASRSGYKDWINSNEGIYSLGIKSSSKVLRPPHVGRPSAGGAKKFSDDSDDADDELARCCHGDNIPTKDSWVHWRQLSHSTSDSLCSWEKIQESEEDPSWATKVHPGSDSKERPEELMSFINSFLPEGGRPSAFRKPSKLQFSSPDLQGPGPTSDMEDPKEPTEAANTRAEQAERDSRRLLTHQWIHRDQARTQSADGRERPLGLLKEPRGANSSQSEENISAVFEAELAQKVCDPQNGPQGTTKVVSGYTDLVSHRRPTKQTPRNSRKFHLLGSSEKQAEDQFRRSKANSSTEKTPTPQRRPVRALGTRPSKGLSIPAPARSEGSRIAPLSCRGSTEPPPCCSSGSAAQQKTPPAKVSRCVRPSGSCSQSPKAAASRLSSRVGCKSSSCSPHLSRRTLTYMNNGEPPTRDQHCETSKDELRSPSPPPPPGRTTSLLMKPSCEGPVQAQKPSPPARGPPPSYAALLPNMQCTLPIRLKDSSAPPGSGAAPPHLPKGPGITQTPPQATLRRTTKDYLPSANSGWPRDPEAVPKGPRSVPPPYGALHGSSIPNAAAGRWSHDSGHVRLQKTSLSLPVSLQDGPAGKGVVAPPGAKTRIPMGFKAPQKPPPGEKTPGSMPAKQKKDHINSVSKETGTSKAQCGDVDPEPPDSKVSIPDRKGEVQTRFWQEDAHGEGTAQSTSIITKAHLKPALGMNGAKARSQSFSSNHMEKPKVNDLPAKIRTQFISSSGERGSSLSRQSSLEVQSGAESPVHRPRTRVSHYGGMTGSNIQPQRTISMCSGGGTHIELWSSGKASSPPQAQPPSFGVHSQNPGDVPHQLDFSRETKPQKEPPDQGSDPEDRRTSTAASSIEEKVMMGIKKNAQKCQEQEKMAASESRQKTGPSLANWFGLRRSKLPALGGKKVDSSKDKEPRVGSGGGKSDKKREKKKSEKQQTDVEDGQNLCEMNNKLSSIIDHCNNHMGQLANQIQSSTAFIGKDQLVRELLSR